MYFYFDGKMFDDPYNTTVSTNTSYLWIDRQTDRNDNITLTDHWSKGSLCCVVTCVQPTPCC